MQMENSKVLRYLRRRIFTKNESTAHDVDIILNNELARKAFKCFKEAKISGDGDAMVLNIIWLNAVITTTAEFLKRDILGKPGWYLKKRPGNL